MIEIYANIPENIRKQTKTVVDFALSLKNPMSTARFVNQYVKTTLNEEEQDFIDFYFNMRLEQLKNQ